MKMTFFLLVFLILNACTVTTDWKTYFDREIASFQVQENKVKSNVSNRYFSYYLPADMQREKSGETSVVLRYEGISILMNVNIADLINGKENSNDFLLEEGFYRNSERLYHREGTYRGADDRQLNYLCEVYEYSGEYLLAFYTGDFHYYTYCREEKLPEVLRHILMVAKSMDTEAEEIVSAFSGDVTIDYQKKQIDLFKTIIPKSGQLSDMVLDKEENIEAEPIEPVGER